MPYFFFIADTAHHPYGGIVFGGDAGARYNVYFDQEIQWEVRGTFEISKEIEWNTGRVPARWYRIIGSCRFPTAAGDGFDLGISGGCAVLPIETIDAGCVGGIGKNQFIQNILATSVSNLCDELRELKWTWPIASIQVFSRPAENAFVDADDECNVLSEVQYCSIPECFDFCLQSDTVINIGASAVVIDTFYEHVATGGISFFGEAGARFTPLSYTASGGIVFGGAATVGGTATATTSYSHTSSGGIIFGGTAGMSSSWIGEFTVNVGMAVSIEDFGPTFSTDDEDTYTLSIDTIDTQCSTCNAFPLVLELSHNLHKAYVLQEFLSRNSLVLPDVFKLRYNTNSEAWQANLHLSGTSDYDDRTESWKIVIEWACVDEIGSYEVGSNYWKYSLLITRRNLYNNLDFDTRILLIFPAEQICEVAEKTGLDFSFSLETQQVYVETDLDILVDVRLLYDNIGLFKSSYWAKQPKLKFNISESEAAQIVERTDIKPIFPVDPLLV